jgi:hypothetical protein
MQFSVFILISALLSLAFASPIPANVGLKGAANLVTAAARFSTKVPKPKLVRSHSLPPSPPPQLFAGTVVGALPRNVVNLPILTDKKGNPKKGASEKHPAVLLGENADGSHNIAPISNTPVHPSTDVKNLVNHPNGPNLKGQVHLGPTSIDPKDIMPAHPKWSGKLTGCEVLGLCNARNDPQAAQRLFNDPEGPNGPNRPKPVRTQSLPPPKLEHHDQEEHNPVEQESDASKTHRKGASGPV